VVFSRSPRADRTDRAPRRLEREAIGFRRGHGPSLGTVEDIEVHGDVPAIDAAGDGGAPARDRGDAGVVGQHPGTELGDPARCKHPRLHLVQDLTAEEAGVGLPDRRAVHSRDQVGIAAAAGHGEGHAPHVARRRRLRRVEVAMRVEPREPEPDARPCPPDPG
jgi:hypothetical protein